LVLFVLVCGIHLAGAHHDTGRDGLGFAGVDLASLLLLLLSVLFLTVATSFWLPVTSLAELSVRWDPTVELVHTPPMKATPLLR
jgi:hypothetical protein